MGTCVCWAIGVAGLVLCFDCGDGDGCLGLECD